jgi:uncharacterized protein
MASWQLKNLRSLNIAAHRDFGYFFSSLIIVYCLSGLALNHVDEWNPDFIIEKETVNVPGSWSREKVNKNTVDAFGKLVNEGNYKVYDFPTYDQVKIYYDNASFHINFSTQSGVYEKVSRRPVFYHSNILHRNSVKGWKWIADIFAVMLIVLNVTGLFILRGKYGLKGRGKWLIAAGCLPPLIAFVIHELV